MTRDTVRPSMAVARARSSLAEALRWIELAGLETGPVRNGNGADMTKPGWLLDALPGRVGLADLPLVLDRFNDEQLRTVWVQAVVSVAAEDGFSIGALAVALNYVRERLDMPKRRRGGERQRDAETERRRDEVGGRAEATKRSGVPAVNGSAARPRRRGGRGCKDSTVLDARIDEARRMAPKISDSFALNDIDCPKGSHTLLQRGLLKTGEFDIWRGTRGKRNSAVVTRIAIRATNTKETA